MPESQRRGCDKNGIIVKKIIFQAIRNIQPIGNLHCVAYIFIPDCADLIGEWKPSAGEFVG